MEIICVDTSLLIEYFRKPRKHNTRLYELSQTYQFVIPAIVAYEFLRGQKEQQPDTFLAQLLTQTVSKPFDFDCALKAAEIYQLIKPIGKTIEAEDLLIAATALAGKYRLVTNNPKHFQHIPGITLLP
jgi:predicted nucleic acid-binding protein